MARNKNAAARRAEIAEALYRCIVKKGYANTSVRDIASEANIQFTSIHYYFENKDEILYTVFDYVVVWIGQRFETFIDKHRNKPPIERLKLGMNFIFSEVSGNRELTKAYCEFGYLSLHDEEIRSRMKRSDRAYRRVVEKFLSECLEEMGKKDVDVKDLAAFMVSAVEGACVMWFIDPHGVSLSRLSKVANRLLIDLIEETEG